MITCFTKTRQHWEIFYLWNNTVLFIPVGKPQKIGSWSEERTPKYYSSPIYANVSDTGNRNDGISLQLSKML